MKKVKLTVMQSSCRSGLCKKGDRFVVGELCPALCHELWHVIYPLGAGFMCMARCSVPETPPQAI